MHPGPIQRGIEISSGVIDSKQCIINDQIGNSVAVAYGNVLYPFSGGRCVQMKTVLKNCRVLGTTHDKDMLHDIYVENGIIEKIGLNLEVEGAKQIDVGGHTVMSGLIDMHCNICDPGHEYIEDIATASRAALRGGFTTITCEPNTDPVIDNKTVVEYIVSKSKEKSL